MSAETVETYLTSMRTTLNRTLDEALPAGGSSPILHEAMRYSVLGGGKRVRPILAAAAAEACGAKAEPFLRSFCALELIHTYSLVHDDLPSMDDDDLRRGRKTCHVVYGEAMAILTGDALLTLAFEWLSERLPGVSPERQLAAITAVATAAGSFGMVGGQVADIEAEEQRGGGELDPVRLDQLERIHRRKTGALLRASVRVGGVLGGGDAQTLRLLDSYGEAIGLAFQIVDDLLDVEGTAGTLGKTAGKDLRQGKLTYPGLVGPSRAREKVAGLLEDALRNADMIGKPADHLAGIARYLCERKN